MLCSYFLGFTFCLNLHSENRDVSLARPSVECDDDIAWQRLFKHRYPRVRGNADDNSDRSNLDWRSMYLC